MHNIYLKPKGNKTDAMPLSEDSDNRALVRVVETERVGSEPVKTEKIQNQEDPGGAHDPMRDDAMDGEELMAPRVPNLPPEPSARQIAEHELTGHAVYRSWCRHCVASKGRTHADSSREEGELPEIGIDYGFFSRDMRRCVADLVCSSVGTVHLDAWVRQLLTGKVRQTVRVRFRLTFIKSLGFKRILVRIRQ